MTLARLPEPVLAMAERGADWAAWVDRLPRQVDDLLAEWELTVDGGATHGFTALVVPVRERRGRAAMLKVGFPDEESEHEHLALTHWHGAGAVRLLRADPRRRAMLLERLEDRSLRDEWDLDACRVVAGLYRSLHVPAPAQFRPLSERVGRFVELLDRFPRDAGLPPRLIEQAASLARDLVTDPDTDGVLVHTDLHFDNVLAAGADDSRGAWLVIDPKPLSGDPHYEIAPMLRNRYDELAGRVRDGVRDRFFTLVDTAELDEDRARAWVIVRMIVNGADRVLHPPVDDRLTPTHEWLTRCVAIAKAVQD